MACMDLHPQSSSEFHRSAESVAFETFWRSLRRDGIMRSRADFHPARALRFLRNMALVEYPSGAPSDLRVRIAGEGLQNLVGANLTGQKPIQLMAGEFREAAAESTRQMFETPCGLWQISPAHLTRGYAIPLELTMFPLAPHANDDVRYLLCFARKCDGVMEAGLAIGENGWAIDTALQ